MKHRLVHSHEKMFTVYVQQLQQSYKGHGSCIVVVCPQFQSDDIVNQIAPCTFI